jgi:hypothetical protein
MPEHARGYASPTILVDGRDVEGAQTIDGTASCRIYATSDGLVGTPSLQKIVGALDGGQRPAIGLPGKGRGRWQSSAAMLPAIGMSLLPKLACPACWPAYAGLMSSVGLGFLVDTTYLLPLTSLFLAVAVGALAFRAQRRRGFRPFVLGLIAASTVLVGKFALDSDAAMYGGLATLVGASLWNAWPKQKETPWKRKEQSKCSAPDARSVRRQSIW